MIYILIIFICADPIIFLSLFFLFRVGATCRRRW